MCAHVWSLPGVSLCGASLCVSMWVHLSHVFTVGGGGCSFTPMLVNSDGWDGDHSSPGGELCVIHVLLLLLIVRVHLHK